MRVQPVLLSGFCCLLTATAMSAGSNPVAVSPGDASKLVLIGDTCPTFSWGGVDGARDYEVGVYRLGEEPEGSEPVVRKTLPGSVGSWTPVLELCFETSRPADAPRADFGSSSSGWPSAVRAIS